VPNDGTQLAIIRIAGLNSDPIDVGAIHAGGSLSNADCSSILGASSLIGSADCTVTLAGGPGLHSFEVQLEFESSRSVENNLLELSGNLPLRHFSCNMGRIADSSVTCSIEDMDVQTITYTPNGYNSTPIAVTVADASTAPNQFFYVINDVQYGPLDMAETGVDTATALTHAGSATLSFASSTGHTLGATWQIAADGTVTNPGYKEFDICGGVGQCDINVGMCTCQYLTGGVACDVLEQSQTIADTTPLSTYGTLSSTFSSDIIQITSPRDSSSYNFIRAIGNGKDLFSVSGAGQMRSKTIKVDAGQTISSGGLLVLGGGHTIMQGSLKMSDGDISTSSGTLSVTENLALEDVGFFRATADTYSSAVLKVAADRDGNSNYNLL